MGLCIEKLGRHHAVEGFDCGQEPLNRFLIRYALQAQMARASQTYLALDGPEPIGYYTLVVGQVAFEDAPERLVKGLARHPVPVMVLARLAIDHRRQGQGLGAGLLKDAFQRTLNAADIAGIRALIVHAKDEAARQFYQHFDFTASPSDPMHLMVLLKDVAAILRS